MNCTLPTYYYAKHKLLTHYKWYILSLLIANSCYRCGGKWDSMASKCLLSGCTLNDSIHWPEDESDQVEEPIDELMAYDMGQPPSTKRKSWQRNRWSMSHMLPNMSSMRRIITRPVSSRRQNHMVLP
jgi:hypothetical protein